MGVFGNFIYNIIALIGTGLIYVIVAIFSAFGSIVPVQIQTAWTWIIGFVHVGDGIIPTDQLLLAVLFVLFVWKLKYAIKIFLHTIFPMFPIVGSGSNPTLPPSGQK